MSDMHVGDKVLIVSSYGGLSIGIIDSLTKANFFRVRLADGKLHPFLFKLTGDERGGDVFNKGYIKPFDQQEWDKHTTKQKAIALANKLRATAWAELPLDVLKAVKLVITTYQESVKSAEQLKVEPVVVSQKDVPLV
jgi:hypothetical protein